MTWLRLVLQNGARRKLRTLSTAVGIALAVGALFSLVSFQRGYQIGMRDELDKLGAHILIAPKGCPYDAASIALHGASWPCYLKADYLQRVKSTEGVAEASPMLMNALTDQVSGSQSVYVGANLDLLGVKRAWKIDGAFPLADTDCLIGSSIAKAMHLQKGQQFDLPCLKGETGSVSGILQSTQGADDTFIYVTLARAQKLFGRPGELTHILVRLTDPDKLDSIVAALRGCEAGMDMNVVPLTHLFRTIQGMVNSTRLLLLCILAVGTLVAGAGVGNTVLMAVTERTREIGIMRAIGASAKDIFLLVWLETLTICALGWGIGIVGAMLGAHGIEVWLRARLPFAPTGTLVHPELGTALACLIGALLLGSVAGLLPAWRAAHFSPIEAMRVGSGV